jgi:hypothetical protein
MRYEEFLRMCKKAWELEYGYIKIDRREHGHTRWFVKDKEEIPLTLEKK